MERVRVWAAGTSLFDKIRVFLHDISMAGASLGLALYLRVGPDLSRDYGDLLIWAVPLFMLIAGSMFLAFGMYRGVWRYTSISDTVALAKAVTASVLLFKLSLFFIDGRARLPLSVPLIQWLVLMAMVAGPRLSYRVLCARAPAVPSPLARLAKPWSPPIRHAEPTDRRVPVLLVGVGDRTALFIRAIEEKSAADAAYRVVGILGNSSAQLGRSVHGVPVLGTVDDLAQVIARLEARHQRPQRIILFDEPERLPVERVRRLIGDAERSAIQVARLDQFTEVLQAQPAGPDAAPGPYRLEDLLGREPISLDRAAIVRLIAGRRVLVTGAGGSIGSELCQQIAALGPKRLVLADASEFNLYSVDLKIDEGWPRLQRVPVLVDVRDRARLETVFAEHRPELVFHAAALKHVPMVEGHPCEGVLTNVIGTRNVADAACRHGTKAMVLISTDKAVNPTSMMGASKRLAEFYCQALDFEGRIKPRGGAPRFITVRFGNVLGSSGSVIPLFQHQLARGGPLTVTHPEVCRYFMTIQEAVELVLQASAHGVPRPQERGQIYVLDMGEPIKLVDIARRLIRLHGKIPDTDVRLTFVGLRSGEKLYEELFDAEEERQASVTRGVLAARSQPRELGLLRALYEALECAARRGDEPVLERLVTLVLPSYQSSYAAAGEHAASPPEFLPAPSDAGAPAADIPFAQLLRNGDRDRRSQLGSVQ